MIKVAIGKAPMEKRKQQDIRGDFKNFQKKEFALSYNCFSAAATLRP